MMPFSVRRHIRTTPNCMSIAREAGLSISSTFDSGNIKLVEMDGHQKVRMRILCDPLTELEQAHHMQWFAFRSTVRRADPGVDSWSTTYEIDNAGLCSYASAWEGAEVCVSHDQQTWRRVPTRTMQRAERCAGSLSTRRRSRRPSSPTLTRTRTSGTCNSSRNARPPSAHAVCASPPLAKASKVGRSTRLRWATGHSTRGSFIGSIQESRRRHSSPRGC